MDALILTGIMGLAIPAIIGAACWLDPKGAEWLAARLRGRAVELRMMKAARTRAKARAGEVYQECRVGWEYEDREGVIPEEAQANG